MKVAVLGANGYIARNLVYVMKRDNPDWEMYLYGIEDKSIDGHSNYVQIDMTDRNAVKGIDLSCDIIFMFVGKTGSTNCFDAYDTFINLNERTLLNLLSEYRNQNSVARIIYPSTRLVYKGVPFLLREDAEKEFKTIYAIQKFACENYLKQYNSVFNVQYTIVRICVPYGTLVPGASSYGTAEFMMNKAQKGENITLYGDGSLRRTITHIEDLCLSIIKAAVSLECANDVFNIGGEDYSLKEMALPIAGKYNVEIEYISWPNVALSVESGNTVFDSTKLDNIIGKCRYIKFSDWMK